MREPEVQQDGPADPVGERSARPLAGYRIGVTAARKAEEQVALLERRGAEVTWGPALSTQPHHVDPDQLRADTERVLARPVDVFVATTGVGMTAWSEAAGAWGLRDALVEHLAAAEVLARGPKSVGALRRLGLRERWSAASEEMAEVLDHLAARDLDGLRIVVQEHGLSLTAAGRTLERAGADVQVVGIYRTLPAEDPGPVRALVDLVADRSLDAVTFTSAPGVAAFLEVATTAGRLPEVVSALRTDVLAACVGPVTAAAFAVWDVPSTCPPRSRTGAMVTQLEVDLASRHGAA